jgi:hypothetical protein
MTRSRGINKPRAVWTDEMVAAVIARYPHEKTEKIALDLGLGVGQVFSKATKLGLEKTQVYLDSPDACRLRREDSPGVAFRFPKGHVPANKGVKGISYPGMEATQFKKGEMSPRCKAMYKPIGSHRINTKDGYLERKMTDGLRGAQRWKAVHRIVWEEANGPIPKGFVVRFRTGMKTLELGEITVERLEMISMADNMRRNTIHNLPPALKQVIQLTRALKRKINGRRRKNERANDTTNQ